jgi:hypothetical protein
MINSERWIVGSALLGLSLVLGAAATAMEPDKKAPSAQSTPTLSLPAFVDGARLPGLQDTWRQANGEPAPVPHPSNPELARDRLVNEHETPVVANATAEQTKYAAATVRERAEELSLRFGGGASPATTATGDVPGPDITTSALENDAVPARAQGEQAATVAPEPTNLTRAAGGVKAEKKTTPVVKGAAIPPIPVRAPRTAQVRKNLLPPASRIGAVPRSEPPVAPVAPAIKRASPSVVIPSQLQSFGWASQD